MNVLISNRVLNPSLHGNTVNRWKYNEELGMHLWDGKALSVDDFNKLAASAEWKKLIEREGEKVLIQIVRRVKPQAVQVNKSASYTGRRGSSPRPASTRPSKHLMKAAEAATPPN